MIEREQIHEGFIKYHLNCRGEEPWPFRPVLHHFSTPDLGDPHDHPWDFRTFILKGSYIEDVYALHADGLWSKTTEHRREGQSYDVHAKHIHKIIEQPEGDVWTLVFYGHPSNDTRFYEFSELGYRSALWNDRWNWSNWSRSGS